MRSQCDAEAKVFTVVVVDYRRMLLSRLPTDEVQTFGQRCGGCPRMRLFEVALGLLGFATFLFGISFVKGAVEEEEPEAERVGAAVFILGGLGLMLLAGLTAWLRARRT